MIDHQLLIKIALQAHASVHRATSFWRFVAHLKIASTLIFISLYHTLQEWLNNKGSAIHSMRVTSGELGHKIAGQSLTWDWEAYFTGTFWLPIYPIFGSEQDKPCAKPQTLICRFYRPNMELQGDILQPLQPQKSALGGSGFGCKFLGTPKPNLSLYELY